MMSSSSNKKKVRYTESTMGKSSNPHSRGHSHKSSRDSGVGSSSASDRASVGDTTESPFNSQEIQYQRHNPTALAEALDAANEKIRELFEQTEHLQRLLKDSNKEKRSLKGEKNDLLIEVEDLGHELKEEKRAHDKLRKESGQRIATSNSSSTRRSTPPSSHRRRDDERSQGSGSYHEEAGRRYIVPQPPPSNATNPFIPLNERPSAPSGVIYAPPTTTLALLRVQAAVLYQILQLQPTPVKQHHDITTPHPPPKCQYSTTASPQTSPNGPSPNPSSSQRPPPAQGSTSTYPPRACPPPPSRFSRPPPALTLTPPAPAPRQSRTSTKNGRVTIMFCSFGASPRIMRFFCTGRVVEWDQAEFESLLRRMGKKRVDGARAVIMLTVWKVQTSCGYGVPRIREGEMDVEKGKEEDAFQDRDTLGHWAGKKVERNEMGEYQMKNNARNLDGLPGLRTARRDAGERFWVEDARAKVGLIMSQKEAFVSGVFIGVLIALLGGLLQAFVVGL
ncbi:Pyridoxamine 5'-phosphate oxidase family protein [Lachnellula subtilissima]|uniref:Pyridoxamine 5'-phosphate oxidase family protein n=1 Tax=Lachnellula subtilissima TaxID=602034 RepID=A0A8H8RVP0_9HELO|nr:Pyridoxamine 5'-phosphate oxidase family protein [Lachnellula subtilissima]